MKLLAILAVVLACASLPRGPSYLGCEIDQECYVLQVENTNFSDAVLYLNGARFGYATGLKHTTLAIHRTRLDAAGCAQFTVRLLAGEAFRTTRECVTEPRSRYDLFIGSLLSTTNLTPYAPRYE
jgi:hypothetical protein